MCELMVIALGLRMLDKKANGFEILICFKMAVLASAKSAVRIVGRPQDMVKTIA